MSSKILRDPNWQRYATVDYVTRDKGWDMDWYGYDPLSGETGDEPAFQDPVEAEAFAGFLDAGYVPHRLTLGHFYAATYSPRMTTTDEAITEFFLRTGKTLEEHYGGGTADSD